MLETGRSSSPRPSTRTSRSGQLNVGGVKVFARARNVVKPARGFIQIPLPGFIQELIGVLEPCHLPKAPHARLKGRTVEEDIRIRPAGFPEFDQAGLKPWIKRIGSIIRIRRNGLQGDSHHLPLGDDDRLDVPGVGPHGRIPPPFGVQLGGYEFNAAFERNAEDFEIGWKESGRVRLGLCPDRALPVNV